MFPLVEPAVEEEGYGTILLDSNASSNFSLTNAVGVVNSTQLRALKSVLSGSRNGAWLILLHHHVVEYPVLEISLSDRIGLALINAPDLLAAITPHARRTLILHGHRHVEWVGMTGETVLCSAPSVTLGKDEYRGRFNIYELTIGPRGTIHIAKNERVKVIQAIRSQEGFDRDWSGEAA